MTISIISRIDSSYIDSDLTNFPVQIKLSSTDKILSGLGVTDYEGFHFTVSGVECYAEIDVWDMTSEVAVFWVKVPLISSSTDTVILIRNNGDDNTSYVGVTGSATARNVWDSNYVAVYHLSQSPDGTTDEIINSALDANHGTSVNMSGSNLVDAFGAKAIDIIGSTVDDYINCGSGTNIDDLSSITVETFVNFDNWGDSNAGRIISKTSSANDDGWGLYGSSSNQNMRLIVDYSSSYGQWQCTSVISLATEHFLGFTLVFEPAGTFPQFFSNASKISGTQLSSPSGTYNSDSGNDLWLGARKTSGVPDRNMNGKIGEVRISNVVRSDAWMKAAYYVFSEELITNTQLLPFGSGLIGEAILGDLATQSMSGCCVSDDRSILLVCGSYADVIYVLTGTNINDYELDYSQAMTSSYHNALRGVVFAPDGYTLFVTSTDSISFTSQPMTTAYDLTTLGAITRNAIGDQPYSFTFNDDGTKVGINFRDSGEAIASWFVIYSLSTAYDVTSISSDGTINIGDSVDYNAVISPDGLFIFVLNRTTSVFEIITLTAAWTPTIENRVTFLTLDDSFTLYQGMYCVAQGESNYDIYFTDSDYSGIDIVRQIRVTQYDTATTKLIATIDATYIDSALTNYPVKISFDDRDGFLFGKISTDWQYLHITANSIECYVEVVIWNMDQKNAVINVLVPSISNTVNTELEITFGELNTSYVGEVGSTPGKAVWAGYLAVYHMHSGPADSGPNSSDGTDTLVEYTRAGISYCAGYVDAGVYTSVNFAITGDYTISFLYNRLEPSTFSYSTIITNNTTGDALTCIAMDDDSVSRMISIDNNTSGGADLDLAPAFDINKWYHVAVVRNGSNIEVFLDGVSIGSTASGSTDTFTITRIGMRPASATNRHNHFLSELRMIESVLSDDEIKAEANLLLGNLVSVEAYSPPVAPTTDQTFGQISISGKNVEIKGIYVFQGDSWKTVEEIYMFANNGWRQALITEG